RVVGDLVARPSVMQVGGAQISQQIRHDRITRPVNLAITGQRGIQADGPNVSSEKVIEGAILHYYDHEVLDRRTRNARRRRGGGNASRGLNLVDRTATATGESETQHNQ